MKSKLNLILLVTSLSLSLILFYGFQWDPYLVSIRDSDDRMKKMINDYEIFRNKTPSHMLIPPAQPPVNKTADHEQRPSPPQTTPLINPEQNSVLISIDAHNLTQIRSSNEYWVIK